MRGTRTIRLYYFTAEQWGLKAIRDSRLKIARIDELNDSFEFLGLSLPGPKNRKNRKGLRERKRDTSKHYGLICMSATWQEPLLWSHYADKHQGLCLGFDCTNNNDFEEMKYERERPTLQDFGKKSFAELDDADIKKMLRTKFEAWGYEQEYRALYPLQNCDLVDDMYFLPFSEDMRLVQVIVGEKSKIASDKFKRCLRKQANAVSSFKARPGFTRFEVVKNTSKSARQYYCP